MIEHSINPVDDAKDVSATPSPLQLPVTESATTPTNNETATISPAVAVADAVTAVQSAVEDTLVANSSAIEDIVAEDTVVAATAVAATSDPEAFDPLQALTSLLVGSAVEGSAELLKRLQRYEQEIREEKGEADGVENPTLSENDMEWLRYTLIGFIFEQQGYLRRTLSMAAQLANQSTNVAAKAAAPIINSRYANPLQRRYNRLIQRGAESVARWTQTGRLKEPESRELARKAYTEIIDEFIGQLADNDELQDLVTQQGLGLAAEVRDEVRERTVTGDNVLEGVVRRLLRRTPREELPLPPEEVQKWAQFTFEDRKKLD